MWLDNQTSLVELSVYSKYVRADEDGGTYPIRLNGLQKVQIQDNGIVQTRFINVEPAPFAMNISRDKRYLLDRSRRQVIDLETFELTRIIREDAPTFDYQLAWDDLGLVVEFLKLGVKYRVFLP